jgi:RNA polymerase sigma factor (sigma-70 family)
MTFRTKATKVHLINPHKIATQALRNGEPEAVVATDGELLVRFARHADHRAFAQIVERHGGLVWIVCRDMLRHHQDVEDAFQATFLVLAERANSIRSSDSAAAWLHRVAQRTALSARRKRARQREEELLEDTSKKDDGSEAISHRELIYVLLDELRKLPDRYQVPLVLRYFERMSRQAIAAHTDSTIAQIQGRLVRGRRMLRSRMLRRGVSLSLATGAVAGVSTEAESAITPAIANVTARRCLARKTSGDTTGITPMALWLANQGARTMWLASVLKTTATISAVLFVAGITWAVESGGGGNAQSSATASTKTDLAVITPNAGAAKDATHPTSANVIADELDRNAANLDLELNRNIDEKADLSAELEWQQLQKASIQRELEAVNDAFGPLNPDLDSADEAARKHVAAMEQRLGTLQKEFKKSVRQIAEITAAVDQRQRKVKRSQDLLDNIDRLRSQLDMQRILDSATATPASPTAPPASDYRIQPQDILAIQAIGALADQPVGDAYYVEPMGTVALGPAYGRVKVVGLTILEAEEAIKKKLSEVVAPENLKVQATIVASRAATSQSLPAQQFSNQPPRITVDAATDNMQQASETAHQTQVIQQLQHESEALRKENADLKKKLGGR